MKASSVARFEVLLVLLTFALIAHAPQVDAQIAVVSSTVEEHTAAPGQSYQGTVLVQNLTAQPQPVRIYQTDIRFFADGTSRFDDPATMPRSNARWVTPSATSIVVPPSSEVSLGYTVRIPAGDSLRGSYWSAIMVEGALTAPPSVGTEQVGIGAVVRYAVQLTTHLPVAGSRKVAFSNQAAAVDSLGRAVLDLDVENIGERAYRPLIRVELYDVAGTLRARKEQQRGLLYPTTSLKQQFVFDALPRGAYTAVVTSDTGDATAFVTKYKLAF